MGIEARGTRKWIAKFLGVTEEMSRCDVRKWRRRLDGKLDAGMGTSISKEAGGGATPNTVKEALIPFSEILS